MNDNKLAIEILVKVCDCGAATPDVLVLEELWLGAGFDKITGRGPLVR